MESLFQEFIVEATEQLDEMETNLLQIEKNLEDDESLRSLFRLVHTIKGSSEYIGLEKTAVFLHALESLLDRLRNKEMAMTEAVIAFLFRAHDEVAGALSSLSEDDKNDSDIEFSELLDQLESLEHGADPASTPTEPVSFVSEDSTQAIVVSEKAEKIQSEVDEEIAELFDDENIAGDSGPIAPDSFSAGDFEQMAPALSPEDSPADVPEVVQASVVVDNTAAGAETDIKDVQYRFNLSDEADQELFSIFSQQLVLKMREIKNFIKEFKENGDLRALLRNTEDPLKALRNSANYMNYREIVGMLDTWITQVDHVRSLEDSPGVNTSGEFMMQSFQQMLDVFSGVPEMQAAFNIDVPTDDDHLKKLSLDDLDVGDLTATVPVVPTAVEKPATPADPVAPSEGTAAPALEQTSTSVPDAQTPTQTTPAAAAADFESQMIGAFNAPAEAGAVDFSVTPEPAPAGAAEVVPVESMPVAAKQAPAAPTSAAPATPAPTTEKPKVASTMKTANLDKFSKNVIKTTLRVDATKVDQLINQAGELVVIRSGLYQLLSEFEDTHSEMIRHYEVSKTQSRQFREMDMRFREMLMTLSQMSADLQDSVMSIRMLPISNLFDRYPRLVRELTRSLTDKKVELHVSGAETELDRMLIEELAGPMVHVIRNAVDHGLESSADRLASGKPEAGQLHLSASHEGNFILIETRDDGRGLQTKKIAESAIRKGLITAEDAKILTSHEIINLITKPGFSTAEHVTSISGRGVGLDAVKKGIENLNGSLDIYSVEGEGTTVCIKLPLTLAIIQSLLVKVGTARYSIALTSVEETLRTPLSELEVIDGTETLFRNNETVPLIRLSTVFGVESTAPEADYVYSVIVSSGMKTVGFIVDELLGQEEIVIKPLDDALKSSRGFSGATVLGDGSISLILDVSGLIEIMKSEEEQRQFAETARTY